MNYDEYLIREDKNEIENYINKLKKEIKKLEKLNINILNKSDINLIQKFKERIYTAEEILKDYNNKYVDKKIDQYSNLFTNINNSGIDLNRQQCEAIVRNDKYNQVIAAAGTGKTLVLTYRIKYLIDEGVSPKRILAITYTKEASKEMKKRLNNLFDIKDVEVSTIHSFAYKIVRENSPYKLSVIDSNNTRNIVESLFNKFSRDLNNPFSYYFYSYTMHKDDEYIDETDFETKSDYVAEMKKQRYITLKGEEVRSRAEKAIADFLYTHRIEYQYEKIADWSDRKNDKGTYNPDFYLPDYDIYIEHWGVDREGKVPEWFTWTSKEYNGKIKWAKKQFETYNKKLIETYDYEYQENSLELILEDRLEKNGVKVEKMSIIEYIESVYKNSQKDVIDEFINFINTAKTYNTTPDKIEGLLNKKNKRQFYFGLCGKILLFHYNKFLEDNRLIDFNDMIFKAIKILEKNPEKYYKNYDHMLVDEFQDVGDNHINFIKQFLIDSKIKLFCVGDDWQSIYSFQGSEPKYFIKFDEYFGEAAKTYLVHNFRCPKSVLDAGNKLISTNQEQIMKKVVATSNIETIPHLHTLTNDHEKYPYKLIKYTVSLVKYIINGGVCPGDIMILSRNDDASPYLKKIKDQLKAKKIPYKGKNDSYHSKDNNTEYEGAVSVYSVHQSKGREAKHVILIHVVADDTFSFPAPERNNELVAPLILSSIDRIEEERRLFYVAITRVKENLHIISQKNNKSQFINEIQDYLEEETSFDLKAEDDEELYISFTARVYRLFDEVHRLQTQAGILRDISNNSIIFISWKSCNPPILEKNIWYKFRNVKLNEFNDKNQIVIDEKSEVIKIY